MEWQERIGINFMVGGMKLHYLLFADDQILIGKSENISQKEARMVAFRGTQHMRFKIVVESKIIEQFKNF
jgi:hypothetical protein